MTTWLDVRPDDIPEAIRLLPAILWRAEPVPEGKPKKVPYRVAHPRWKASSTDPTSWGTFDDAIDAYTALVDARPDPQLGPVAGVGLVLLREARIVCLDLDRTVGRDGTLDPLAETVIDHCESWAEYSPSGTGVHVWVYGTIPHGIVGDRIEVYGEGRYIAITGHQVPGTPDHLAVAQDYLGYIVDMEARGASPRRRAYAGPSLPPPDDLVGALLARLQRWGIQPSRILPWNDGYAAELPACPWAHEHTTGPHGAAVLVRKSGAFNFTCRHAHCDHRDWYDFRALMDPA